MSEDPAGAFPESGGVQTGGSIVEVLVHGADVPPEVGIAPS
jgi:hypothetical protein